MVQEKRFGLSSTVLRFIAMVFMLLDHMWATVIPGNNWMTYVGRMALPIFVFLIAEGYAHTRNVKNYKKRLFLFGLISEIPFNLMVSGSVFFIFHQNVMFTLLLGLFAIEAVERMKKNPVSGNLIKNVFILMGLAILATILFVDYNIMGVVMVVLFHVTRKSKLGKLWQFIGMFFLNIVWHKGMMLPVTVGALQFEFSTQGFAMFALLFIWFYNGRKGYSNKVVQYFGYAFYPLHMILLYMAWLLM